MADKKTIYIVIGVVCLVLLIPITLVVLGMLGGVFYYMQGGQ